MNAALMKCLQRLVVLHQIGNLTDNEFKQAKASLISGALDEAGIDGLERLAKLSGEGLSKNEFAQLKASILGAVEKRQQADTSQRAASAQTSQTSSGWKVSIGIVAAVSVFGAIYYALIHGDEPNCGSAETTKLVTEIAQENGVLVNEIFSKMVLKNAPPEVKMLVPEAFVARAMLEKSGDYERLKKETSAKDYSLDVIRLQSKDSVTKAIECKAILRLATKSGKAEGEFSYTAEKTSDGRLYVVLDTSQR